MRSAVFLALIFGVVVATKSAGYAAAYPTLQARAGLSASFSNNIGLNALFGTPHHIDTVAGFAVWNTLNIMMIFGAVWAFLTATRLLRGQEDSGRWELLLAGQTTARRAAANALVGLGVTLVVLYGLVAVIFAAIGRMHNVDFQPGAAVFFALAAIAGAALFMAIGALAAQLMPTRSRAAGLSGAIFGACFLLRAMADTTNAAWLLDVTPLGWIEKLQPLYGSQPVWLIPLGVVVLASSILAVYLAGRRDLGTSLIADQGSAKPRTGLLSTPLGAAVRLTRASNISWLLAVMFVGLFFGLLTKSAAMALSQSLAAKHIFTDLSHGATVTGATTFLGVVFFLLMVLIMAYVASAFGRVREDEAEGYLDNLLVRPVDRWRWLLGRLLIIAAVLVLAGLLGSVAAWAGEVSQHAGVPFHLLLLAGLNAITPAAFILGVATCVFGWLPRLTTLIAYGAIGWSFLLQIVNAGVNLNHWLLDTSVLQQVALAPAVDPKWFADLILIGLGTVLCIVGGLRFQERDLASE